MAALALALLGSASIATPSAAQDGAYSPDRYPPPPASFDPSSIVTHGGVSDESGWGWGWAWITNIDGSGARLAAPARRDAKMMTPDAWLQPGAPTCLADPPGTLELMRPGERVSEIDHVVSEPSVMHDSAWVGRARTVDGKTRGLGIWRIPADGGPPALVWGLRDTELYGFIFASQDGRRIAVERGFDPLGEIVPPRPRIRIDGRTVATLPRYQGIVGWDARGGLIVARGVGSDRRVSRWDPATHRIRPIDRPDDEWDVALTDDGLTLVVEGRYDRKPTRFGIIDLATGERRDIRMADRDLWAASPQESTSRYLVFDSFSGPFPDGDPRRLKAVFDLEEGWLGYVVVQPVAGPLLPTVTVTAADGTPRPPAWFDASSLRYAGSPTGDPTDLSRGLWAGAIDGSVLVRLAPAALQAVVLTDGTVAWTERSAGATSSDRAELIAATADGHRLVLAQDIVDGPILADPDGTAVWAWRDDSSRGRSWWRIPTDGSSASVVRAIPPDAVDIHLDAGGGVIGYRHAGRDTSGSVVLIGGTTDRSGGQVVSVDTSVIGFTCGGMPIGRAASGLRVIALGGGDGDPWILDARPDAGVPAVQNRDLIASLAPRTDSGSVQSVHVASRWSWNDPGREIRLTAGDWHLTALGTDRYLVLRDGARDRFGVLDLVEIWFAELPFIPRLNDE